MVIDFSFFRNPENLLFLFIILLAASAILFIVFFILSKIFKLLKKFFSAPFSPKSKPKQEKSVLDADKAEPVNTPRQRVMGGYFVKNVSSDKDNLDNKNQDAVKIEREKEMASAVQGLEKLKSSHSSDKSPSKLSGLPDIGNKNQEIEDDFKKIKIPRRKRFESAGQTEEKETKKLETLEKTKEETGSVAAVRQSVVQTGDIGGSQQKNNVIFKKPSIISDKIIPPPRKNEKKETEEQRKKSGVEERDLSSISAKGVDTYRFDMEEDLKVQPKTEDVPLYEKPDILNNDLKWISKPTEKIREEFKTERAKKIGESDRKNFVSKKAEDPFFGNKVEISRSELRQKLRNDPNVWRAQKEAGLSLSPLERVKLEKEVFSQALGSNISRADLKSGIGKLHQKMRKSTNISEQAKIRKEISFFKKIGGIK